MPSTNLSARETFSVSAHDHPLVKVATVGSHLRAAARSMWGKRADFRARHVSCSVNGGVELHVYDLERVQPGEVV